MRTLAGMAACPVAIDCGSGSCGICEHQLLIGDKSPRYSRLCVSKVPKDANVVEIVPSDRF